MNEHIEADTSNQIVVSNTENLIKSKPSEVVLERIRKKRQNENEKRLRGEFLKTIYSVLFQELDLNYDWRKDDGRTNRFQQILNSFSQEEVVSFTEDHLVPETEKKFKEFGITIHARNTSILLILPFLIGTILAPTLFLVVFFACLVLAASSVMVLFTRKTLNKRDSIWLKLRESTQELKKIGLDPIKVLKEALIEAEKE